MCAISGILNLPVTAETKKAMLATMERRGPDAQGIWECDGCTLLHARLAVIDPATGVQPMSLSWAGENYAMVYNGELYNAEELRQELESFGHRFKGHSDTEVLIHSYAQWGVACLEKCNGIFAFGVYEEKSRKLLIARDRIGVKPLFYKQHQGGFLFASEIKTILKYPTVKAELDAEGAGEILLLGPGRTPGCGIFRGIEEMEPGCYGYFEKGRIHIHRYWKLRDREHTDTFEETVEKVRFLVLDAIMKQMVSDVPLGTFLSGGLDSSLITAVCARKMQEKGSTLDTFSVDYVDNDQYFVANKFQPNTDGYYIRRMQEELQTNHHWCVLSPEDLMVSLEEATIARDLPGMADVDFSLLAFCKEIRRRVTVALSGECADEIFGGYPWYRDPAVRDTDGFPWAQNTKLRCDLMTPNLKKALDGEAYIRDRYLQTCRESDILPGQSQEETRMKQMVNLNMRWFMQTLLDRKDRMSMYSGLEVRVPFCDYRIAEYLYGVPWAFKNYQGKEKGLLRYAMEGILPAEVLWRKKSPYPKTFDPKYKTIVTQRLRAVLQEKDPPLLQLVTREAAERILTGDQPWPWYGQLMTGPQTVAYLLQINFWLEHYKVDILA